MPISVSMHACSTWPLSIDFVSFRFFLAGYSVEEAVEQLMALQHQTPPTSSLRGTSDALLSSSTSSNPARNLAVSPASSSHSVSCSVSRRRHRQKKRESHQLQPSLSAIHVASLQTEDRRLKTEIDDLEELTIANAGSMLGAGPPPNRSIRDCPKRVFPLNTTAAGDITAIAGNGTCSTALSSSTAACVPAPSVACLVEGSQTHYHSHHHDREKRHHGSEKKQMLYSTMQSTPSRADIASSTTTTHTSLMLPLTHENAPAESSSSTAFTGARRTTDETVVSVNAVTTTADTSGGSGRRASAASSHQHLGRVNDGGNETTHFSPQRSGKRSKDTTDREFFFLDEGYIRFQRQLQEVEAIGGAGVGFSSLQSRYLFEEVTEQYQVFRDLAREEQLGSPYAFLSNYYIPIPVATRLQLLQMYYETDAGVFQWTFGDKLSRFDLPAALNAAREEKMSGALSAGIGGLGNGTAGNGNAADGVGGAASFWTARWKSSPGKLSRMDPTAVARLSEQHVDALRRQWENVKHVCSTVAALYRGKGGMCVPLDMPLLTTIHQCFGLRHQHALDYATAAFGFEHRLETRLFEHLHSFSEYGAICSVVASLWCDRSGYLLCEVFRDGCHRLSRLLDEYRVISELHMTLFGEAMRPRWQVQLDEVQRVITTSSLVDKNAVTSATTAVPTTNSIAPGISGGVTTPVKLPGGATPTTLGPSTGVSSSHLGGAPGGSAMGGTGPESGNTGSITTAASPTFTSSSSATNIHSPLSGNGQYSRSFLMEFPSLMKHLFRISVALGSSGGINDALDIFFTRIYSYLEHLSSRTAPAIVSRVMSAAAPGGPTLTGASATLGTVTAASTVLSSMPVLAGGGGSTSSAHPSSIPSGPPPGLRHGSRAQSDGDLSRVAADKGASKVSVSSTPSLQCAAPQSATSTCLGMNVGKPSRIALSRVRSSGHLPRQVSETRCGNADSTSLSTMENAGAFRAAAGGNGCLDEAMGARAPLPYVVSPVVNTSLFQPASVLLPLTAVIAANNGPAISSFTSSLQLSPTPAVRGSAQDGELGNIDVDARGVQEENVARSTVSGVHFTSRSPPSNRVGTSSPSAQAEHVSTSLLSTQVSDMVLRVVDKRYLRELCKLLTALPHSWQQLTVLTGDDHTATDRALSDLVMALKAITQVLMASDDFH